jgi:hypothetical protein
MVYFVAVKVGDRATPDPASETFRLFAPNVHTV